MIILFILFIALISQSYCTGQEVDWESIKKYTSALDKFIDKKIEDLNVLYFIFFISYKLLVYLALT